MKFSFSSKKEMLPAVPEEAHTRRFWYYGPVLVALMFVQHIFYAFNGDNVTLALYNGDILYSRDAYEGTALVSFATIVCYSFYVILKISRDEKLKY